MQSRLGRRRQLFKLLAGTRVRVVSKLAFRRTANMTAKDYPEDNLRLIIVSS
ncbi:MAG: hypothetical protein QOJ56_3043 [Mycobacterium sp.]|jgi:hypothetical protein|nr:hypothetical protein [Mycobacterium sp.]